MHDDDINRVGFVREAASRAAKDDGDTATVEGTPDEWAALCRALERLEAAEAIIEEWRRAGMLPEGATPGTTAGHIREITAIHWETQRRLEMVLQDAEAGNYQPPWEDEA